MGGRLAMLLGFCAVDVLFILWVSGVRKPAVSRLRPRGCLQDTMNDSLRRKCFFYAGMAVYLGTCLLYKGHWVLPILASAILGCPLGLFWANLRMRKFSVIDPCEDGRSEDLEGKWIPDREFADDLKKIGMDMAYGRVGVLPLWTDLLAILSFNVTGMLLGTLLHYLSR